MGVSKLMSFRDKIRRLRYVKEGDIILPEDKNELNDVLKVLADAIDIEDNKIIFQISFSFKDLRCEICNGRFHSGDHIVFLFEDGRLYPIHLKCAKDFGESKKVVKKRKRIIKRIEEI